MYTCSSLEKKPIKFGVWLRVHPTQFSSTQLKYFDLDHRLARVAICYPHFIRCLLLEQHVTLGKL